MTIQKTILACAISTLALAGCGTEEQDGGGNIAARTATSNNAASGTVVDGPITRAVVYYDLNGNLKKDSYEPYALTDNNGHYNYDMVNGVSYCYGETYRSEFCLELTSGQKEAITSDTQIIVTGGYDLYTGEPFEGTMSFPALSSTSQSQFIAITPMTSMIEKDGRGPLVDYLTDTIGSSVITLENVLNLNFLASEEKFHPQAFAITYRMHKYVTVISDWVNEHYSAIEDGEDLPSDISAIVYREFIKLDEAQYALAWDGIRGDIEALYGEANLTIPAAPNAAAVAVLSARLAAVNSAVETAFGNAPLGSDLTFPTVKGLIRGVEVVVLKIIRGETETSHVSALAALSDSGYKTSLQGDVDGNFNFTKLVETTGTTAEILQAANNATSTAGTSLDSDVAGKSLEFSDTEGRVTSAAAIYFTGNAADDRGDIHLCLQYTDLDDTDNNVEGSYIPGHWEANPALNNTLMLSMTYLGERNAVLKKVGTSADLNTVEYRFDFAGEIINFESSASEGEDLVPTAEDAVIPTSDEACQAYFDDIAAAQLPL